MLYTNLEKETKKEVKTFLLSLNKLLRDNNYKFETPVILSSKYNGVLGEIEDQANNLYLVDPETLIEYETTEE